jgi:hypothetical protein
MPSTLPADKQTNDRQSFQPISTSRVGKERITASFKEGPPAIAEKKEFQLPPETKEWVEEKEFAHEITLPGPVKDEYDQILLKSARATRPNIKLPLNNTGMQKAKKHPVVHAVRWLYEWCKRIILKFPGRVVFQNA